MTNPAKHDIFTLIASCSVRRNSSISIVHALSGRQGFNSRRKQSMSIFHHVQSRFWALWPTLLPNEYQNLKPSWIINQPEYSADQSPRSSVKVKNTWSFTSSPPYFPMTLRLTVNKIYLLPADTTCIFIYICIYIYTRAVPKVMSNIFL